MDDRKNLYTAEIPQQGAPHMMQKEQGRESDFGHPAPTVSTSHTFPRS